MTDRARLLQADGFNQLAAVPAGYWLYNIHDLYIGQAIAKYGEYARLETRFLEPLCHPGDIVIDVGANIGVHTVTFARRVGSEGAVIAFEPQRLVFQALCANVALNSLANVECHQAAIGATRGTVVVPELDFNRAANFGAVSLATNRQGRPVPMLPLDDFAGLPRLRLVKIDIEGMEIEAIEGAKRLIAQFRPLLYVENDRVENSERMLRLIDDLGYDMYWHVTPLFNPDNAYGERDNIYEKLASFNVLGVHRDARANVVGVEKITDFASHPLRPGTVGTG